MASDVTTLTVGASRSACFPQDHEGHGRSAANEQSRVFFRDAEAMAADVVRPPLLPPSVPKAAAC